MPKFRFYLDPGHGWLEVPQWLVRELGIPVTTCSYVSLGGTMLYLEQDCDAPRFLDAIAKLHGGNTWDYYTYHELGRDCFIRGLPRYNPTLSK